MKLVRPRKTLTQDELGAILLAHLGNITVSGNLDGAKEVMLVLQTATRALVEVPVYAGKTKVPVIASGQPLPTMREAQAWAHEVRRILAAKLTAVDAILPTPQKVPKKVKDAA